MILHFPKMKILYQKTGKNNNGESEEKKVCLIVKFEYSSPDLLDENKDTNIAEYLNIFLNQLLQKKQKALFSHC